MGGNGGAHGRPVTGILRLGAVAALAASSVIGAVPAMATGLPIPDTTAGAGGDASARTGGGLSEVGLAVAVQRDLGLTPAEFVAAGELGAQAAAAAQQLRDVPGYLGIRLEAGRIAVTGSGPELTAAVAALSSPQLVLEAPAGEPGLQTSAVEPVPGTAAGKASTASGAAQTPAQPNVHTPAASSVQRSAPAKGLDLAVSARQVFESYLREVGPEGLQAVVATGEKFLIRIGGTGSPESSADLGSARATAASPGKLSPAGFVARYANVELDGGAPLAPEAEVPGGLGYSADTGWVCSTGFSAFDPRGMPAILTAGHCASDGAAKTATLEFLGTPAGYLGRFGFSQFGGPGNSPITGDPLDLDNPANVGTDIAVLEALRPDLNPLPAASTWGHPSQPGPDVKIIGSTEPVLNMPICRSGRTSAWSCGTVDAVGIFVARGPDYPANQSDLRAYPGFLSYGVQSNGGDSGGPYISGNYAVGTHAAGEDAPKANEPPPVNFAVGATLKDSLAVLPGYELELFLNAPVLMDPAPGAPVEPGQPVSGTVPAAPASAVAAGSRVRVTPEGRDPFEVPVDETGKWSFPAPEGQGPLRFSVQTVNGFSTSQATGFEFQRATGLTGGGETPPKPTANPLPTPSGTAPAGTAPADTVPATIAPASRVPAATEPATSARESAVLAATGSSSLLPAAGIAAAALGIGGLLIALVRRRQSRASG